MSEPTVVEEIERLREHFESGATRPLAHRHRQLQALRTMLAVESATLLQAMASDLGRPRLESWITDIWLVDRQIAHTDRNLRRWSRSRTTYVPLASRPARGRAAFEPYGVSLVVAPWNYPVQLTLVPLASAIAAGNCVVLKPSELAPATAAVLAEIVPRYLSPRGVAVVPGGPEVTHAAIEAPVDHVFFTGSNAVGVEILKAAAPHLTPVTLELGGKSPAIVCTDADLASAARRIVFGKFVNAGQSCVAPDYVLVDERVAPELVERLRETIDAFYGTDPARSPDYGRVVNGAHIERLRSLLSGSDGFVIGGVVDPAHRYFGPTLLLDPSPSSPAMSEEVFGPILPVVAVADLDAALSFVAERPAPLACYCFTRSRALARRVERATRSGAFCVNTTIEQLAVPGLPFGGAGESGFGSSHGRAGFETFSRRRAVLRRRLPIDPRLGYPPYSPRRLRLLQAVLRGPRGSMPAELAPRRRGRRVWSRGD